MSFLKHTVYKSYLILLELEFRSPGNYRIGLTGGTTCNHSTQHGWVSAYPACIAPVVGTGPGTKPPTALASSHAKTGMWPLHQHCGVIRSTNEVKYLKCLAAIFNHSENTELKFLMAFSILVQDSYTGLILELMAEQCFLLLLKPMVVRASVLRLKPTVLKHYWLDT